MFKRHGHELRLLDAARRPASSNAETDRDHLHHYGKDCHSREGVRIRGLPMRAMSESP
jgi:hypothetical protein